MAELHATFAVLKEAIFVCNVSEDMFAKRTTPQCVTDGKSSYDVTMNPGVTKNTVHYERWLYFVRDANLHQRAQFYLTTTDKQMADSLTKIVDRSKFFACRNYMMNILGGLTRS